MNEIFKIVDGYPAYRVSNLGTIQSRWNRGKHCETNLYSDEWKTLKHNIDTKGYHRIGLCDGINKVKTIRIHTLVTQQFLGDRKDNQVVRHVDGNKNNNSLDNLIYGTYKENEDDKKAHGTWDSRITGAKLTIEQVIEIKQKIKNKQSDIILSLEYKVSRPTITRIRNNKIWKNII